MKEGHDGALAEQGARTRSLPSSSSGSATPSCTRRDGCSRASSVPRSSAPPATSRDPREADPHRRTGTWSGTVGSPRPSQYARETRPRPDQRGGRRAGSRATPDGPTTSPTGVRRSGTRPRSSGSPWATTRTRGRRRASCPRRPRQQIREAFESVGLRQAARRRVGGSEGTKGPDGPTTSAVRYLRTALLRWERHGKTPQAQAHAVRVHRRRTRLPPQRRIAFWGGTRAS